MNAIKRSSILLIFFFLSEAVFAFGGDTHWIAGFGQGTREALINKGPGNQIYVACENGSERSSSILFMLNGNAPKDNKIFLTFDSDDPISINLNNGQLASDCHACAKNFDFIINKLKLHNSVHVMYTSGNAARFTLKGSSRAIGDCRASFWE